MTARPTLPQGLCRSKTMFQDFSDYANWTAAFGTKASDTAWQPNGTPTIKGTNDAVKCSLRKIIPATKLSTKGDIFVRCYVYDVTKLLNIAVSWSEATTWATSLYRTYIVATDRIIQGENILRIPLSDYTIVAGHALANDQLMVAVTFEPVAGQTTSVSFASIEYLPENIPHCIVEFDDGKSSVYTNAFPVMASRGIRGTVFVIPTKVGTDGYMTLDQLQELYDAGWALGNHSYNHVDLRTLSQAACEAELLACSEWLVAQGFTRAAYHVAYPSGYYNATVMAAAEAAGMLSGRTTNAIAANPPTQVSVFTVPNTFPANMQIYELTTKYPINTTSLATAKTWVDAAVSPHNELTLTFLFHMIDSVGTTYYWTVEDFTALMQYVVDRKLNCYTIDEWYNGLTNPRYRSLPLTRT